MVEPNKITEVKSFLVAFFVCFHFAAIWWVLAAIAVGGIYLIKYHPFSFSSIPTISSLMNSPEPQYGFETSKTLKKGF